VVEGRRGKNFYSVEFLFRERGCAQEPLLPLLLLVAAVVLALALVLTLFLLASES